MNNNDDDGDHWLQSATTNHHLVAHLLLTLRHASPSSPPLKSPSKTWTVRRQRRSRPPLTTAGKKPSPEASPTTPLSWSGGTSVSGGAEESSRRIHDTSDISRSKVICTNETTPTKRPRKNKTLVELKEDETILLRERMQLKRQLAILQATCQKQREDNESLKKMKNDMKSQQVLAVLDRTKEPKNASFALPDLNIPAGEDC